MMIYPFISFDSARGNKLEWGSVHSNRLKYRITAGEEINRSTNVISLLLEKVALNAFNFRKSPT